VEEIIGILTITERDDYFKTIKDKFAIVSNGSAIQIKDSYRTKTVSNLSYEIVKTHFYDKIKENLSLFATLLIAKINSDLYNFSDNSRRTASLVSVSLFNTSCRVDYIYQLSIQLNALSKNNIDIPLLAGLIEFLDTNTLFSTTRDRVTVTLLRHKTQLKAVLMCMIILDTGLEPAEFPILSTPSYESFITIMQSPEIGTQLKEYKPSESENPTLPRNTIDMIKGLDCFIEFFRRAEVQAGLSRSMSNIGLFGGRSEQSKFTEAFLQIVEIFENYKSTGELTAMNINVNHQRSGLSVQHRMHV
jgi:hypothetical protein